MLSWFKKLWLGSPMTMPVDRNEPFDVVAYVNSYRPTKFRIFFNAAAAIINCLLVITIHNWIFLLSAIMFTVSFWADVTKDRRLDRILKEVENILAEDKSRNVNKFINRL